MHHACNAHVRFRNLLSGGVEYDTHTQRSFRQSSSSRGEEAREWCARVVAPRGHRQSQLARRARAAGLVAANSEVATGTDDSQKRRERDR
jgi:hypothetical protein